MNSDKLAALPAVSFAPLDVADVEREVIANFEQITGGTLYPATPERLLCESLAYREAIVNGNIDLAARQNLLAFATAGHLDHLGALMGVFRLEPSASKTIVRFSLSEPLQFKVEVSSGCRIATANNDFTFSTDGDATIEPGEMYAEVSATCTSTGAATNGLLPGQIASLVDRLPYIIKASNVTMSLGGSDTEDDEHLRERIRMAPEAYSNAGSRGAYHFWALTAHADIAEVSVTSPEPGVVDVRPVLKDGELPSEVHLEAVSHTLNKETVRPLTDKVVVSMPVVVEYSVEGTFYLPRSGATLGTASKANVFKALEQYRVWQRSKPGRDINPTKLISLIERAGAKRLELKQPAFKKLEAIELAREVSMSLSFGGYEDD